MRVMIKFAMVQVVWMPDEGIVHSNHYSDNEISNGYGEVLNLRHYVVINQNYNIDIVSEWEPTIEILHYWKEIRNGYKSNCIKNDIRR